MLPRCGIISNHISPGLQQSIFAYCHSPLLSLVRSQLHLCVISGPSIVRRCARFSTSVKEMPRRCGPRLHSADARGTENRLGVACVHRTRPHTLRLAQLLRHVAAAMFSAIGRFRLARHATWGDLYTAHDKDIGVDRSYDLLGDSLPRRI